ncbi:hypothetical protein CJ177_31950 [Rhodococcus sp. ACPA1]|nr:hypothetical protein CJ177_31950 [Rhodococcus sp. ACPA1]
MATAQVVATRRILAYRDTAITALSDRLDSATGFLATPTEPVDSASAGFVRGVRGQFTARACCGGGGPACRLRITEVQVPPRIAAVAQLSAADRHLAQITVASCELD